MSRADESAFPIAPDSQCGQSTPGLTIREHFAALAMQGLLANGWGSKESAELAVGCADALIAELERTKPT